MQSPKMLCKKGEKKRQRSCLSLLGQLNPQCEIHQSLKGNERREVSLIAMFFLSFFEICGRASVLVLHI